jgi:hypothetical protein
MKAVPQPEFEQIDAVLSTLFKVIIRSKTYDGKFYPCRIVLNLLDMPDDDQMVVYGLADPSNGEVFYVGQTVDLLKRLACHCRVLHPGNPRHSSSRLATRKLSIAAANKEIVALVLKVCVTPAEAIQCEETTIWHYRATALNTQRIVMRAGRRY